jgi:uncharacterized repeat protein (TIGR03803 family)
LTTLYSFAGGNDGAYPESGLVRDSRGSLYGSTVRGGVHDYGTIFQLGMNGREIVFHAFAGINEGADPNGIHLDGAGNIYGTTVYGLQNASNGTVFKIAPDRTTTVIYTFPGGNYGDRPSGTLEGLFGTASDGLHNYGVVYHVSLKGDQAVLHAFNSADGAYPGGGVIADGAGNLYGTTQGGGTTGRGTVFKLAPDGTETVLHSFCVPAKNPCPDGQSPATGLSLDSAGNLYGTAQYGGTGAGGQGGTLFKVAPDGTTVVLHAFCYRKSCLDGTHPGPVTLNAAGAIYGVTEYGGIDCDGSHQGCGTVFKFVNGAYQVLHSFTGSDGAYPVGGLLLGGSSIIYGTTYRGGANDLGTVFKLSLQ